MRLRLADCPIRQILAQHCWLAVLSVLCTSLSIHAPTAWGQLHVYEGFDLAALPSGLQGSPGGNSSFGWDGNWSESGFNTPFYQAKPGGLNFPQLASVGGFAERSGIPGRAGLSRRIDPGPLALLTADQSDFWFSTLVGDIGQGGTSTFESLPFLLSSIPLQDLGDPPQAPNHLDNVSDGGFDLGTAQAVGFLFDVYGEFGPGDEIYGLVYDGNGLPQVGTKSVAIMDKSQPHLVVGHVSWGTGGQGHALDLWAITEDDVPMGSAHVTLPPAPFSSMSFDADQSQLQFITFGGRRWGSVDEIRLGASASDVGVVVAEPLKLTVNVDRGEVRLSNPNDDRFDIEMDYYAITSASGSLSPSGWASLQDQNLPGFPAGNGSGNGWEEGGNNSTTQLLESFLLGSSTLSAGESVSLGNAFQVGGTADLTWAYHQPGGSILGQQGLIEYITTPIDGDFDDDGLWQCSDVDALVATIARGTHDSAFDLNGDGLVDDGDLVSWLVEAGAVNLTGGAAYLFGDANLDGVVDVADFNIWNTHRFTAAPAWCLGDMNADGVVDASDFNAWNGNKFRSVVGATLVPEPSWSWCGLTGCVLAALLSWLDRRFRSDKDVLTRRAAFAVTVCLMLVGPCLAQPVPNIILVLADDLGWSDTSTGLTNLNHPSDFFETPTIEHLAANGMAFTNAYAAGPNCAPSRTSLLSGQYAPRPSNNVYLVGNLNRGGNNTLLVGPSQGLPNGADELPGTAVTVAETLQAAGYATAHFGKYHVGGSAPGINDPLSQGFDVNYGGTESGTPGDYHANLAGQFAPEIGPELDAYAAPYDLQYVQDNLLPFANGNDALALIGTPKHVSDALADAAIDFLDNHSAAPMFLHYSHYAVHTPIDAAQARLDLLEKYAAKQQNQPSQIGDTNLSYAALIEGVDQSLSRLVDHLQTTDDPRNPGHKLSENTLLLFTSDNGGQQVQANNGPLRGQKGELDEGGIRVPLVAWSENPDLVDAGTISHVPVLNTDFYRTFAALANTALPANVILDGEDLSPMLADANSSLERDAVFWHLPGYLIDSRDQRPQSVIRSGDFKLFYNYEDQSFELFNLADDLRESINLAARDVATLSDLGTQLIYWLDEVDAPLATLRSGSIERVVNGLVYRDGQITEHLFDRITVSAGEEMPFVAEFLSDADLDFDGLVNVFDWQAFRSGQGLNMSDLSLRQSFMLGDLDHDLDNDLTDFALFRAEFDRVNGDGAFARLVPEPAANLPLIILAWWFFTSLRRSWRFSFRAVTVSSVAVWERRR